MINIYTHEINSLRSVNWSDLESAEDTIKQILNSIFTQKDKLRTVILSIPHNGNLFCKCEHYDILDKLVIHDDPSGFRIRLHLFLPGYIDRPHNHRWAYGSLILSGSYKHFLYLPPDKGLTADSKVDDLTSTMFRTETIGSSYVLGHKAVHSIRANPYTVSAIVRGPSMSERFLVMDKLSGDVWWQYGAKHESDEERKKKQLSLDRFTFIVNKLETLGII